MFTIDFTKPWLYKDIIYFNQGNLSTNNTLRCKLVTGGSDDFTGGSITCTFITKDSLEISGFGKLVDAKNGIIDIVFPSNALVVGANKLEVLVNRADGGIVQSPTISYDVWQGLTTGNGVESETNYPVLIELINQTNTASNTAKEALNKLNYMKVEMEEIIDFSYRAANNADIAASNANYKIDEVDEKIGDVNRALAAGTVDLELKEARKDASGVVHDTVKQRLDSDLIVGDKSLKDFVIDMNEMKESQDLAYETNNSYQVCTNTQVGLVKNLKVYGETMINICNNDYTKSNIGIYYHAINKPMFPFGEDVTIKVFKENDSSLQYLKWALYGVDSEGVARVIKGYTNDFNQVTLNVKDTYPSYRLYLQSHDGNNYIDFDRNKVKVCIVKGNINIVDFFAGITSVGNGNGIEVLTRKEDGNLFDINADSVIKGATKWTKTEDSFSVTTNTRYDADEYYYIEVEPNTNYTLSCESISANVILYDGKLDYHLQGNLLSSIYNTKPTTTIKSKSNVMTVRVTNADYLGATSVVKLQLVKGVNAIPYTHCKQVRKPILSKDANGAWQPVTELKGVDISNCDIVDTLKNKFKKLYDLVMYDGNANENWQMIPTSPDSDQNQLLFKRPSIGNARSNGKCISDKFMRYGSPYNYSGECFVTRHNDTYCYIRINKSRLATPDVEGFKKWLQSNPITMIYELGTPLEYELNPIYPDSFEGDTMVMVNGGPLPIKVSWKITSSLPNFVKELSNQIKQLQEQVYKTNVANFAVALNTLDTKLRLDRLEAPQM